MRVSIVEAIKYDVRSTLDEIWNNTEVLTGEISNAWSPLPLARDLTNDATADVRDNTSVEESSYLIVGSVASLFFSILPHKLIFSGFFFFTFK